MKSAFRYKSIDPAASRPYLAFYPVSDVSFFYSPEFDSIPATSDYFPGPSHACFDFAAFDTRVLEFIHEYEKPGSSPGNFTFHSLSPLTKSWWGLGEGELRS